MSFGGACPDRSPWRTTAVYRVSRATMAWVCAVRERAVARVVRDYFEETALAESSRLLELRAVTRMQAWWRGTLARGQLRLLKSATLTCPRPTVC